MVSTYIDLPLDDLGGGGDMVLVGGWIMLSFPWAIYRFAKFAKVRGGRRILNFCCENNCEQCWRGAGLQIDRISTPLPKINVFPSIRSHHPYVVLYVSWDRPFSYFHHSFSSSHRHHSTACHDQNDQKEEEVCACTRSSGGCCSSLRACISILCNNNA